METAVERNEEQSRYELRVDDRLVGIADFQIIDDRVLMPHTEIEWKSRGQGLGATLVRGALDDVRARGGHVVPRCWYVAEFIAMHAEYQDLRAEASS